MKIIEGVLLIILFLIISLAFLCLLSGFVLLVSLFVDTFTGIDIINEFIQPFFQSLRG
jgi:hypothetical protein